MCSFQKIERALKTSKQTKGNLAKYVLNHLWCFFFSLKVKLTLGVAGEGGPSGSVTFFWKYHKNKSEKCATNWTVMIPSHIWKEDCESNEHKSRLSSSCPHWGKTGFAFKKTSAIRGFKLGTPVFRKSLFPYRMSALITNPWEMSLRATPIGRSTKEWAWAGVGKEVGGKKTSFPNWCIIFKIRQLPEPFGSNDPLCDFSNRVVQGHL